MGRSASVTKLYWVSALCRLSLVDQENLKCNRVFVYGTLKRGLPNHPLLQGSRFLGPAITTERYRMIASEFPVLLSYGSGLAVKVSFTKSTTKPATASTALNASAMTAMAVMNAAQPMFIIGTAISCWQLG